MELDNKGSVSSSSYYTSSSKSAASFEGERVVSDQEQDSAPERDLGLEPEVPHDEAEAWYDSNYSPGIRWEGEGIPVHADRPTPPSRAIFGLRGGHNHTRQVPHDNYARYPPDGVGEELGPNARIFRAFNKEALDFDTQALEKYKDSIDVLLVFAGLFSAVVTAFVVQTSQNLQPDYAQLSAVLLIELVAIQRASVNGTSIDTIPSPSIDTFARSSLDVWINSLWFISLILSLTTSLVAVLAKQWLHHYSSPVSGTTQERAHMRQFRYIGLEEWQVPVIIGSLPVLLHLSLAVFVVGIVLFLHSLQLAVTYAIGAMASIVFMVYVCANMLPAAFPQCPYQTPLSSYTYSIYRLVLPWWWIAAAWLADRCPKLRGLIAVANSCNPKEVSSSLEEAEGQAVLLAADRLNVGCINWLYTTSTDPAIKQISIQSISGLRLGFPSNLLDDYLDVEAIFQVLRMEINSLHPTMSRVVADDEAQRLELYWRAFLQLRKIKPDTAKSLTWYKDPFGDAADKHFRSWAFRVTPLTSYRQLIVTSACALGNKDVLYETIRESLFSPLSLPPFIWICLLHDVSETSEGSPDMAEVPMSIIVGLLDILSKVRMFCRGIFPNPLYTTTTFSNPSFEMASAMLKFLHAVLDCSSHELYTVDSYTASVHDEMSSNDHGNQDTFSGQDEMHSSNPVTAVADVKATGSEDVTSPDAITPLREVFPDYIPSQLLLLLRLVGYACQKNKNTNNFDDKILLLRSHLVSCFCQYIEQHHVSPTSQTEHQRKASELDMIRTALVNLMESEPVQDRTFAQEHGEIFMKLLDTFAALGPFYVETIANPCGPLLERSFSPTITFARNVIQGWRRLDDDHKELRSNRTTSSDSSFAHWLPPQQPSPHRSDPLFAHWLSPQWQSVHFYQAFLEENALQDIYDICGHRSKRTVAWTKAIEMYISTIFASDCFLPFDKREQHLVYIHMPEHLLEVSQVLLLSGREDIVFRMIDVCHGRYDLEWRGCVEGLVRWLYRPWFKREWWHAAVPGIRTLQVKFNVPVPADVGNHHTPSVSPEPSTYSA